MKYLILISYLLTISFVLLYFYYRIGILKVLSTLTLEELNKEQEFADEKLEESDYKWIRNLFVAAFSLLGFYLWLLMGTTFGLIATEMATSTMLKWVLYPLLFMVLGGFFLMLHRMIKIRFEMEDNIQENVFFILAMSVSFVLSIAWPQWVSGVMSWPVKLVLD